MEGKLGAIYIDGRQVGGFLDWHVKLNLNEGVDGDDRTRELKSWRVKAWAHWLTRQIALGADVKVKICADDGPAYWEGMGKIAGQLTSSLHSRV